MDQRRPSAAVASVLAVALIACGAPTVIPPTASPLPSATTTSGPTAATTSAPSPTSGSSINSDTLAPALTAEDGSLSWTQMFEVTGYNVYGSPVSGGGYVLITDEPLDVAQTQFSSIPEGMRYFVVTSVAGDVESAYSNEVELPVSN